jgi:hypothetical protein
MSNTPSLVMHDGALGSHPKCEVRARIITDDPTVGLYLFRSFLEEILSEPSDRWAIELPEETAAKPYFFGKIRSPVMVQMETIKS